MCESRFSLPSRAILDEGLLVHNTWLILSVVAALSQRLSHARFGISTDVATFLMAQERSYDALDDQVLFAFVSGTCLRRAPQFVVRFGISGPSAAERTSLAFLGPRVRPCCIMASRLVLMARQPTKGPKERNLRQIWQSLVRQYGTSNLEPRVIISSIQDGILESG